jgi:prolipoprotein diacylglyceryltransferase
MEVLAITIIFLAFALIYLGIFLVGIASLVFWILMLVDSIKREYKNENEKITWILVIVLAGIIGALIYYFMVKRKKTTKKGKTQNGRKK